MTMTMEAPVIDAPYTVPTAPVTVFTLPLGEAIEAFSAVLPHAAKDDMTPIICAVRMLDDGRLVATDRYTVGTYQTTAVEGIPAANEDSPATLPQAVAAFTIPRDAAEYVTKIVTKGLRHGGNANNAATYNVRVTGVTYVPSSEYDRAMGTAETLIEILYGDTVERSQRFDGMASGSSYPPVVRLLDNWEASADAMPIGLTPEHLEKILGYSKKFRKNQAVKLELGKTANTDKPAAMRATAGKLVALIQPNHLLR